MLTISDGNKPTLGELRADSVHNATIVKKNVHGLIGEERC